MCHRTPSMVHFQACCDGGFVDTNKEIFSVDTYSGFITIGEQMILEGKITREALDALEAEQALIDRQENYNL